MFIHQVYFWLNHDVTDAQRQAVIDDCHALLERIETVRHLWAGKPAMTPRPVVDNSYDVGLCVVFDDAAGHQLYQPHPLHEQFISRHKPQWKRVQVYDFATD